VSSRYSTISASRFLFLVTLSAFYCWQLTLAGLSVCLLELGLLFFFGKRIQELFKQLTMKDESARLAVEIIENVRTMQLLCKQVRRLGRMAFKFQIHYK